MDADAQAGEALVEVGLEQLADPRLRRRPGCGRVGGARREPVEAERAGAAASGRRGCASTGTSSVDRAWCTARGRSADRRGSRRARGASPRCAGRAARRAPGRRRSPRATAAGASVRRERGQRRRAAVRRRVLPVAGQHAFEEAPQLLAGVRPGRPLVGHVGLQHRQRAQLAAGALVLDGADDRGREARAPARSGPARARAPGSRRPRGGGTASAGSDRRSGRRPRRAWALMLAGSPSGISRSTKGVASTLPPAPSARVRPGRASSSAARRRAVLHRVDQRGLAAREGPARAAPPASRAARRARRRRPPPAAARSARSRDPRTRCARSARRRRRAPPPRRCGRR